MHQAKQHQYEGSDEQFACVGSKEITELKNHAIKKDIDSIMTFYSSLSLVWLSLKYNNPVFKIRGNTLNII